MRDRITHASDGTASLERDHPLDSLDGLFDFPCEDCGEPWEILDYGRLLCLNCAGERAADRKRD